MPIIESCYPCIKSTKFVRKMKVNIKFGGIFGGGGAAAPCAPPPGSGADITQYNYLHVNVTHSASHTASGGGMMILC